jgi:hypothetical protein
MINCLCKTKDGYINRNAYEVSEVELTSFTQDFIKNKKRSNKGQYLSIFATFDIETSTFEYGVKASGEPNYISIMYQWQMALSSDYVVFGRTWNDYVLFIDKLKQHFHLAKNKKMVIYVHNLSFEYQYLKDIIKFDDIFATAPHKVNKAVSGCFEYRCSYILSNMSLSKFLSNENTLLQKGVDDLDYKVFRDSESILSPIENGYCYNDVAALYEAIENKMKSENDTLLTIPLTSTGYVRRDVRKACCVNKYFHKKYIEEMAIDEYHYKLLKETFRGGNTASNVKYVNKIVNNVISYDFSSSYPARMLVDYYPMSKWKVIPIEDKQVFEHYLRDNCVLMRVVFEGLHIKEKVAIPYVAISKSIVPYGELKDVYNGRVVSASYIQMTITEIDLEIIRKQYNFKSLTLVDNVISVAKRGLLPLELRQKVREYFVNKTQLKGIDYYFYMKNKALLNAIYGMCVTDICFKHYQENEGKWKEIEDKTVGESLDEYYKDYKSFLQYSWGVWITCHARKALQDMIDLFNDNVLYVDTDSVKVQMDREKADIIISKLNNKWLQKAEKSEVSLKAIDSKGIEHCLGVAEFDGKYKQFKTLGAKKYAYTEEDNSLHITIAGVPKKDGAEYLKKYGLKAFSKGFVFENIKNALQYNEGIGVINYKGKEYNISSNIAIYTVDYSTDFTFDIENILSIIYNKKGVVMEI